MKPVIVMLILALTCRIAQAEQWVLVPAKDNDDTTLFVDLNSIIREGNNVVIMTLTEYQTPQKASGKEFNSERTQIEFDCSTLTTFRVGPFNDYQYHGGKGIIIHGYDQWNDEWFKPPPEELSLKKARSSKR
jgi:hypothetical protein